MKKIGIRCAFLLLFLLVSSPFFLVAAAETEGDAADITAQPEAETVAPYWRELLDMLPQEVVTLLPENFFSTDPEQLAVGVKEAGSAAALLSALGRATGLALRENLQLLAQICGVLLISAVFRSVSKNLDGGLSAALSFCGTITLVAVLFSLQRDRFLQIFSFFKTLRGFCAAALPLMGILYAMGGNVGVAAANHGMLTLFLSVLETAVSSTVMPIAGICLALALPDAVSGRFNLRSIAFLIKRTFVLALSFLMTLLCGVLGMQTVLAKGSDTLALRAMRFAAGSFLPVVGGSVSEALRTVAGSVQYLRSVTGVGMLVVLLLIFLPILLSVVIGRITFLLGGSVAKLLGCDGEERILSEMAAVYGYFLAVIACLFVMVVFSVTLFAGIGAAGGSA